jgi:hypothetical protein
MTHRLLTSVILAIGLLAAGVAYAGDQESAAIEAANEWIALLDAGDFRTSWERSALLFQNAVSASQWEASVTAARRPFGKFVSREVLSAEFKRSLPGAPDGQYVVIQYRSAFEKKQAAVETVTPMLEEGDWKISGYYIK